ncbi:MAG: hypothetical protein ABEJ05_08540 [Haloglomus sp.]
MPLLAGRTAAHVGALGGAGTPQPVPFWLVALTGGGLVGGSFLFTSLMTDHETIQAVNASRLGLPSVGTLRRGAREAGRALGVLGLLAVVTVALFAPAAATNAAVLLVWVGWWAGYTATTYLLGNSWPALNPWRTLAARLPSRERDLPDVGAWPATAGLLGLVWLEVVSPVASDPRFLAVVILGYTAVTLAGAAAFGDRWFARVDPVSRVFRLYGWLAPVQRTGDGLAVRLPGGTLPERGVADRSEAAFVVALLWVTTFDGLVSTPAWNNLVGPLVAVGVPASLVYLVATVAGFGAFLGVYRLAAGYARQTADTYVSSAAIEQRFAPALLPIAAGYHLAHYLGYVVGLAPALWAAVTNPFGSPALRAVVLPDWFGGIALALVVLAHLVAIWVAHAIAFDLFPGRLQPIRSQYPFIIVMIAYTATSMWIVSQPFARPIAV